MFWLRARHQTQFVAIASHSFNGPFHSPQGPLASGRLNSMAVLPLGTFLVADENSVPRLKVVLLAWKLPIGPVSFPNMGQCLLNLSWP